MAKRAEYELYEFIFFLKQGLTQTTPLPQAIAVKPL
jgi:hypothetical protein